MGSEGEREREREREQIDEWMDGSRAAAACSVGPRDDGERVRLRVADKGGTDGGVMEQGAPR